MKEIGKVGVGGSPASSKILSTTEWFNFVLTREELEEKQKAILGYESQLQMLGRFMESFMGPTELYGRLDASQIDSVPQEFAAVFRRKSS
jgi:hypothetical protein